MTACSTDVFFALLGATSRLHDLLAVFRATSRMLLTVTSPFKIGLTVLVLMAVFAAESGRVTRGIVLSGITLFGVMPLVAGNVYADGVRLGEGLTLLCVALATVCSRRLVTATD